MVNPNCVECGKHDTDDCLCHGELAKSSMVILKKDVQWLDGIRKLYGIPRSKIVRMLFCYIRHKLLTEADLISFVKVYSKITH